MGYPVRDFHSFAETVERNFHDRKTNWTIVFLANVCSDSRAGRYIIENFSIMDELSNEINFYLPGYSTSNLRNYYHRNEEYNHYREEEKNYELYQQLQNASFEEFQRMLRGFESRTIIHKNELQDIRNTLDEMNSLSYDNERMDYKGEGISVIRSKLLGNILFNDAEFSSFVLEFSSLCKEYIYQGGCDMILIRTLNGKLSYENAVIYNLDAIIDSLHGPSLDSFLYHVFNVFRGELFSQNTRDVSLYDLLNDIRRRDGRDNKIIDQIEQDIMHMNNPFYAMFHRSSRPTEEDILFRIDKYLLMSQIDELYHEATYYGRTREEPYQIIIRREIELHLRWNLDEEFYFISYSNQDTSKAMMVKTQMPSARYVLTASNWAKMYERRPKRNARPLVILRKYGPVDYVFEIADTEPILGKLFPLTDDQILGTLADPYATTGEVDKKLYDALVSSLSYYGIELDKFRVASSFGAQILKTPCKIRVRDVEADGHYVISVNDKANMSTAFASIRHELGHFFCYHLTAPKKGKEDWWTWRRLTWEQKEFEAEIVSFIICERYGVGNKSWEYLSQVLGKDGVIPDGISIDRVFKAANEVERMLNEELDPRTCYLYFNDKDFKKRYDKSYPKKSESLEEEEQ